LESVSAGWLLGVLPGFELFPSIHLLEQAFLLLCEFGLKNFDRLSAFFIGLGIGQSGLEVMDATFVNLDRG
jgi:hypothetical protein